MTSSVRKAKWTIFWKITWEEFTQIKTHVISKHFIAIYENVAYQWRADSWTTTDGRIKFYITFERGPFDLKYGSYTFTVDIQKSDKSYTNVYKVEKRSTVLTCSENGLGQSDVALFQQAHGLSATDPLVCRISLTIPLASLADTIKDPNNRIHPFQLFDEYKSINDPESKLSDLQLISNDGKIFYCHAFVLGRQSDGLAALFRHRQSEEEKRGIFRFPNLDQQTLDLILQFLYTGKMDLIDTSMEIIMDLVDFAQQYGLEGMKIICTAALWDLAIKKPEQCFDILCFADLHGADDERMKYLKDRAMNVLVENYENYKWNR